MPRYPLPAEKKKSLPWPDFKMKFLAYCKQKRRLARLLAAPIVEDVAIPVEVMRQIDEEF